MQTLFDACLENILFQLISRATELISSWRPDGGSIGEKDIFMAYTLNFDNLWFCLMYCVIEHTTTTKDNSSWNI